MSKQTHAINKSEVYSHYLDLGLLFHHSLAPEGSPGVEGDQGGLWRHNRDKQSKDAIKKTKEGLG